MGNRTLIRSGNQEAENNQLQKRGSDILIIDDEILMRTLIEKYVKHSECLNSTPSVEPQIFLKESGWDLLEQDLEHVRVAVVDILLPRVTGVDLIKDLRKRYPQMGIVAVTGMATEPMKRALLELIPPGQLLNKPLRKESFNHAFEHAWEQILPPIAVKAEFHEEGDEDLWTATGALSRDVEIPVVRRRIARNKTEVS